MAEPKIIKLKNPQERQLTLLNGDTINMQAEIHGQFMIHAMPKNGELDWSIPQVTHIPTGLAAARTSGMGNARKVIKLLLALDVDWDLADVEKLKVDPNFRQAFEVIKPFRKYF